MCATRGARSPPPFSATDVVTRVYILPPHHRMRMVGGRSRKKPIANHRTPSRPVLIVVFCSTTRNQKHARGAHCTTHF